MSHRISLAICLVAVICLTVQTSHAFTVLGTGTGALVGGDLTDPENDGNKGGGYDLHTGGSNAAGFNATFFASDEQNFNGGENAFNVFSNDVGGGNNKWCCGTSFPQIVGAMNFNGTGDTFALESFTVTSSNDSPQRDPQSWRIEGSNDTTDGFDGTWTTIYDHSTPSNDWAARNQVNRYSPADGDTFESALGYGAFRMVTDQTGATAGAFFAINEIEFFGSPASTVVPEPTSIAIWTLIGLGMSGFGWWRIRRKK